MGTAEHLAEIKARGKDPMQVQRETPRAVAELIKGVSREELRRKPAPGKWSVSEIVAHLAEDEIVQIWRYRQMIENPGVALAGFDQDKWAQMGDYGAREVEDSLQLFRLLRESNVAMFSRLSEKEWQSHGVHGERGPMTVRSLFEHMAGHDLNHLEQIKRILKK
jgi:DinB superfamily